MQINMARARRIAAQYRAGATVHELMDQERMSYPVLRQYLHAARCPIRKRGRPLAIVAGPQNPAMVTDVRKRLVAGQSVIEIARLHGVSRQAISQTAQRYGFPVRQLRRRHPLEPLTG